MEHLNPWYWILFSVPVAFSLAFVICLIAVRWEDIKAARAYRKSMRNPVDQGTPLHGLRPPGKGAKRQKSTGVPIAGPYRRRR